MSEYWKDPERRARQSERMFGLWKDPVFRAQQSERMSGLWKDPAFRAKHFERVSERLNDPAVRRKAVEAQAAIRAENDRKVMDPAAMNARAVAAAGGNMKRYSWLNNSEPLPLATAARMQVPGTSTATPRQEPAAGPSERSREESPSDTVKKSKPRTGRR